MSISIDHIEDTRGPDDDSEMRCAQCARLTHLCICPEGPDISEYTCFDCGEYLEDCECDHESDEID